MSGSKVQVKISKNGKYAHPGEPRKPALVVKAGEVHEFNPDQAARIVKKGKGKLYFGEPEPAPEVPPPAPPEGNKATKSGK